MAKSSDQERVSLLITALGIDQASFGQFLEWVLSEHLVRTLSQEPGINRAFFQRPDALRQFRLLLAARTRRQWSEHDVDRLFDRVKDDQVEHFRERIPYEELLKLLWQVPYECANCKRHPPDVKLHVDHIIPASKGGRSKRWNLQLLCATHNLRKSNSREVMTWLDLS